MAQATVDEYLKSVYYNPKHPGSFGGVENLFHDVKQEGTFKLSQKKKNSDWLMGQDTYTLHKPAHRNIKRNRVIVGGGGYRRTMANGFSRHAVFETV